MRKALFWGRELQAHRADLALRILKQKRELREVFAKYGGVVDDSKITAAEAKRTFKALKRLKEMKK